LFHFTEKKRDFITFEKLLVPFPIHTANSSTYITGKGTVVLRHLNTKNTIITTTLPFVFFCEDLTCHLLSLGAFLQDGLTVSRNKGIVSINTKSGIEYMTFKPRSLMDTIYVLQILDWVQQYQNLYLKLAVNYETAYCHFRHLSWKVLRHTREHTIDFLNIEIPTDDPVCPGCVLGKMSNCPFVMTWQNI